MFRPNDKGLQGLQGLHCKALFRLTPIAVGAIASLLVPGEIVMGEVVQHRPDTRIAHQVEIAGNVGGTIHIEPNDTPRAGEEALTWFALTKRGGEVIPLSRCDCSLAVYRQPYREGDGAIATPSLRAISAEGYNGIPGADIVFPNPGAYELVLTGQPRTSGAFSPFEITFSVTVVR